MRFKFIVAGLFGAVLVGGCGGGSGNNVAAFVGTWTYNSGASETDTCNGSSPTVTSITGQMVTFSRGGFSAGVSYDLVVLSSACNLYYTVNDTTANLAGNQSCSSGTSVTEAFTEDTYTIESSTSLSESYAATANVNGVACSIVGIGSLTKTN